ncbi:unnamed protein product [Euphydryas editha]|uniref:Trissin n=1 Tax=Euphydryas editha TaxID=104508 RepID=A0AAU9UPA0_EUPED|nr:unnamed protein product [Euphydryas editha]
MLKITAFLILMCIGTLLAASMSCKSCGPECAPACGTRHFRTCCFNYLRRKRGPDTTQFPSEILHNLRPENNEFAKELEIWELTPNDYELYHKEDKTYNALHNALM